MIQRYGDRMCYYSYRFMKITEFLEDYEEKLKVDGFIKIDNEGYDLICKPLMQALCELPFSKRNQDDSGEFYEFDYNQVVERTKELLGQIDEQ
jgi:hypothetical protein